MTEAELVILEFDQIGGRDTMEEYFEVGFGVGVGSGIGVGSGVGVEDVPGPSPSQVML